MTWRADIRTSLARQDREDALAQLNCIAGILQAIHPLLAAEMWEAITVLREAPTGPQVWDGGHK